MDVNRSLVCRSLGVVLAGVITVTVMIQPVSAEPCRDAVLSREALVADLDAWLDWTAATHPDLSYSADLDELEAARSTIRSSLPVQASCREAWLALAWLNPVLNDAHTGLNPASERSVTFPPVEIRGGRLYVAQSIDGSSALQAGDEIVSVSGRSMREMIDVLAPTIRGESDNLRRRILELSFPDYLNLWLDGQTPDQLVISRADIVFEHQVDPQRDKTALPQDQFGLYINGSTATLTVPTFDRGREAEFADFLSDAFARISAANVAHLMIDISENGGGARELSDTLLSYLTADRYTPTSAVTARIVEENIERVPGAEIGQVVRLPFPQWVQPPADLPNRFVGDTVVLVGPNTYSQAIVFGAIVQDFGIGRIAGEPTEGAANQTGQVQRYMLPNTGFEARAPLYIFTRASGETGHAPLRPNED